MWSQIFAEASTQKNFNFGFCSYKSETLVHLSQWQYWWWFWFSLLWAFYFLIIHKNISNKNFNFNLVINTSLKGHGKWGDFLIAIIPLSWCGNILVNSNFILRMIEWQNESSLMTIRVQGKQWYWVYKYSGDLLNNMNNVYRNIGNNNWVKYHTKPTKFTSQRDRLVNLIFDFEFYKNYNIILEKNSKIAYKLNITKLCFDNINWKLYNNQKINENLKNVINTNTIAFNNNNITINNQILDLKCNFVEKIFKFDIENNNKTPTSYKLDYFNLGFKTDVNNKQYEFSLLDDVEESSSNIRTAVENTPITLITNSSIKLNDIESNNNTIFLLKNINNNLTEKIPQAENFWGFSQKKYKKLKTFNFNKTNYLKNTKQSDVITLENRVNMNNYNFYNSVKINKNKSELIPVTLARRLLRTKRTLVLPAHVNLTVITNSYDVVHSWFIPGLGIKLDCVPGRSTHHTFYIDNIGFYYGQCAEICGRYHHHMPIRVCALSFEHFLLWWQTKGLPRLCRFSTIKTKLMYKF